MGPLPRRSLYALFLLIGAALPAPAQTAPAPSVTALHRALRSVRLDPTQVYTIRDASLDREDIHLTFTDGTLAFSTAVDGRITAAFFEGDGELLVVPPDKIERGSLTLFTGAPVLEERFSSIYLRFDDDTAQRLRPFLRPSDDASEFLGRWGPIAQNLSETDATRLLLSFTALPSSSSHFLHARMSGLQLGTFDLFLDTLAGEQITIGQARFDSKGGLFDLWTSFPMRSRRQAPDAAATDPLKITDYKMRVRVQPPHELEADAWLDLRADEEVSPVVFFELSRHLKASAITLEPGEDSKSPPLPLEFIQNEFIEASELGRRGNDLVAVVLPRALQRGEKARLHFTYAGPVMSEAGGGLMYVGARGTWYPNRGLAMASFDLEFRSPAGWILVATGERDRQETQGNEVVSHWRSSQPIPLAGFNLGRYSRATLATGDVSIETYAASGVENTLTSTPSQVILVPRRGPPISVPAYTASQPAPDARQLEQKAARAVDFYIQRLGALPYSTLSLTQMPGGSSQGWPGLIFLSTYAFLPSSDRAQTRVANDDYTRILYDGLMLDHEIAHQWWGDAVYWRTYRDQWIMEALANYSALMLLESRRPEEARAILDHYRKELLAKSPGDTPNREAGPVTLGLRLSSSKVPEGFETVAYGRGTWLIHMLRTMLRDTAGEESFRAVLRDLQERFRGRAMSTADLQAAFEKTLPRELRYEGRASLDWYFQGWVNGTAVPRLRLRDVTFSAKNDVRIATGKLLQEEAPRDLVTSVPIYADVPGQKPAYVGRIFADGEETSFRFIVPAGTRRLLLDPYQTVLARP